MMIAIADSSPLILLSKVNQLDLLRRLFARVIIPEAVCTEIERYGPFPLPPWVGIQAPTSAHRCLVPPNLGMGEAAVLVLWSERYGDVVLLDDRAARRSARILGAPLIGTLGLLLWARETGLIERVEPILRRLVEEHHFHISPDLVRRVLSGFGEWSQGQDWP